LRETVRDLNLRIRVQINVSKVLMRRGVLLGARGELKGKNAETTTVSLRAIPENFSGCRALELFTAGSSIFGGYSPRREVQRQRDTYTGRAIKAAHKLHPW